MEILDRASKIYSNDLGEIHELKSHGKITSFREREKVNCTLLVDVNVLESADCRRARSSAPTIVAIGTFSLSTDAAPFGNGISPSILPLSSAFNGDENFDFLPGFSRC